jgi:hypothetical protein
VVDDVPDRDDRRDDHPEEREDPQLGRAAVQREDVREHADELLDGGAGAGDPDNVADRAAEQAGEQPQLLADQEPNGVGQFAARLS